MTSAVGKLTADPMSQLTATARTYPGPKPAFIAIMTADITPLMTIDMIAFPASPASLSPSRMG